MAGVNRPRAMVLAPEDDVATLIAGAEKGQEVALSLAATGQELGALAALANIPFGHKIALSAKKPGEILRKYGQPIGRAVCEIAAGDHVHNHNLASLTGEDRGPSLAPAVVKPAEWLRRVLLDLSLAGGMPLPVAQNFAEALWEANLRGVETHGVRRIKPYLERIASGGVDARADPRIERKGSLLLVDGQNAVGHHVASVASDAVSRLAKELGVALALIRNSNHFGFAGYYATRIAAHGQLGVATSNGQVLVAPPGALRPIFSNNPLAIAAPTGRGDFLELDMANSVTSRAKIAMAAEHGEPIPKGLATDEQGNDTEDAKKALKGSLLPLGGEKGFALLFALEVLTGVLSGGAYADQVSSKETAPDSPERVSQIVAAIDLGLALGGDEFTARLQDLIVRLGSLPLHPEAAPLRYPGQRRWELRRRRLEEGVPLSEGDYQELVFLADRLGVTLPEG